MKYQSLERDGKLYFYPMISRPRNSDGGKVRLDDSAFEILDTLYARTGIPMSQLASEMIKYASKRICIDFKLIDELKKEEE